jgi:lysophospholipase L1-like esterase
VSGLSLAARFRNELTRAVFLILGDRAVLGTGWPGAIARGLGCPAPLYAPHPYMLYTLNRNWRSADGRSRHNQAGFRGAEIAIAKTAGTARVVCMGESTTYCTGIADDRKTYPAALERHLKALFPGRGMEVINAGMPGFTSAENVARCLFDVAPLAPDLLVYYYTHNDAKARAYPRLSRDYREFARSWYEPHGAGGLAGNIQRRRKLAAGQILNLVRRRDEGTWHNRTDTDYARNPPEAFRANLAAIAAIAGLAGAKVLFVNPPYPGIANAAGTGTIPPLNRAVAEHRRVVEGLGRDMGVAVFDLAAAMPYPADDAFPTAHFQDRVHLSEEGADLAAKHIAEAIRAGGLLDGERRRVI